MTTMNNPKMTYQQYLEQGRLWYRSEQAARDHAKAMTMETSNGVTAKTPR